MRQEFHLNFFFEHVRLMRPQVWVAFGFIALLFFGVLLSWRMDSNWYGALICLFFISYLLLVTRFIRRSQDPPPVRHPKNAEHFFDLDTVEENQNSSALYQLASIRERLDLVLEAAKIGVWELDIASQETTWSEQENELFDFPKGTKHVPIEAILSRIHPEDLPFVQEVISNVISAVNQYYEVSFRVQHLNGKILWLLGKGRAVFDATGKPARILGINLDITRVREIEEDLRKAKVQAEEANRLKSAFLANMSHEIRTPLGIILGYIDILKDNDLPTQERRAYFEIITRNGQHLAALINDILDLSKVESGELKVKLSHFDLRAIIEEVVTPLEAAAKAKGLFFKVLMDPTLPTEIVSDPMRLKQILLNMISNAIKFTESGGVTIHVSYIQEGEKKWIEIEVQDTGIGIEADKQNLLFRPFVQADASMARKFGGTGLGLALSRKLALTLGGDVTLKRSVPGQGSVFSARVRDHIQSGDQKG